ncbi:Eco57I restriction-modification methylase domain-containing protein [Rhodanobacter terrae]|uniref:site-specific DNA-methyltransferase (adenine-specific) n=1 Tax=Rhodanobacter terrae TaxID=418647 RepID=A0ABW0T0D9_9GAMM
MLRRASPNYNPNMTLPSDQNTLGTISLVARKTLGAFYTRVDVAELLCSWAISRASDKVLEPSFGGCGFLEAAASVLSISGHPNPLDNIYGCDIDSEAFLHLAERFPGAEKGTHFLKKDFMALGHSEFPIRGFDSVVGNPPYIASERFSDAQKESIKNWSLGEHGGILRGKPSLWAYFVIHGATFLRQGGRMAWILPGSFTSSHYAKILHAWLKSKFARSLAISVAERLFVSEGTEESTVVLLAEGYLLPSAKGSSVIGWDECDLSGEIPEAIDRWEQQEVNQPATAGRIASAAAYQALARLTTEFRAEPLRHFADVTIGLVTGDTPFFVRRPSDWARAAVTQMNLSPIAPKSKWVKGVLIDARELKSFLHRDVPCLMLNPRRITQSVQAMLDAYPEKRIADNATFKKRRHWFHPDDCRVPDLLGVFMTHFNPRAIVNIAGVNCTNSYYRIDLRARSSYRLRSKLIAISLQTSVAQLTAELTGRVRGSGALKLEPSEFRELPVFVRDDHAPKDVTFAFSRMNRMLLDGDEDGARSAADTFIFGSDVGASEALLVIREGISVARKKRRRSPGSQMDSLDG